MKCKVLMNKLSMKMKDRSEDQPVLNNSFKRDGA
jgi:hypothetical protein